MNRFSSFLWRFLHRNPKNTSAVAKARLEQVVARDRVEDMSPQRIVDIKREIIRTLSDYFEMDEHQADVHIKADGIQISLIANIPVNKVKRCCKKSFDI